jgi:HSP20 family protein
MNSFDEFDSWFRNPAEGLHRLFDLAGRLGSYTQEPPRIAADLFEDDQNFYARLELPGVKKKDLEVELEENTLSIGFGRQSADEESEEKEIYKRAVTVPDGVDADKVSAKLEDGILTVTLPKAEGRKPRQITVS